VTAPDTIARSLRTVIVVAALCGAALGLTIAAIVAGIATTRMQHATLDAAGAAVRSAVSGSDQAETKARLAELRASFETWGVTAAAFDRQGNFVAGNERLRGDGLPAGRASAPLGGRQMAIVDTRDGYVLFTEDTAVVDRFRASVVAGVVLTLGAAWLLAIVLGGRYGAARARAAGLVRAHLRGNPGATPVVVTDPLFGDLSADVAAAIERLSRSIFDRAEGEERLRAFLAEAAHELRTPLAIAIGYVGILDRGGLADPVLAARIVRDVAAEHARLQELVERILHLARLDAVAPDRDAVADVARVVDEAISLVRPLDVERSLTLESNGAGWAAIAPDELRDAVRNVLENAIRYAPAAAVRATVSADEQAINVQVADAGPGMDAFAAAHAFDRFFRGSDRGDVPGTGLGLAIVRRIAERAGGSATLTSVPGSGTTVTLRFPRAPASAGA
jgi:two-component system OmpR family sensor kinase